MNSQKILIVFATKRGTTYDAAINIAQKLNMPVHLFDCKNEIFWNKDGCKISSLHKK